VRILKDGNGGAAGKTVLACRTRLEGDLVVENLSAYLARPHRLARRAEYAGGGVVAAVDVGTTVLKAELLDPGSGEPYVRASLTNPQGAYGSDVLKRLDAARDVPKRADLRELLLQGIGRLLTFASQEAGVPLGAAERCVLVGNAAVTALFFGDEAHDLSVSPHRSPYEGSGLLPVDPRDLGLSGGEAFFLPVLGGFVGSDVTAGLVASGVLEAEGPRLFIDVGTNGEIALAHGGDVWVSSVAAGPALEGGHLTSGMPAVPGAVEGVDRDASGTVRFRVLGGEPPRGFCGSGVIDLVALMLDEGIMDPTGELDPDHESVTEDRGVRFFLPDPEAPSLRMTQEDVRSVQLAAGAVRAGRAILLKDCGLGERDLSGVVLTGAFSARLNVRSARTLGLVPPAPCPVQIQADGALTGAALCAADPLVREQALGLAGRVVHVNLVENGFEGAFLKSLDFPSRD
jgi:uncharacterized 2Fe-2S/4Fe-4S cluster protein (DUF4445 family)